jgi:HipA-like protein
MIMRIEKEDPNFFDDKDYTRAEIIAKVSHNMCLQISQFRSKVFQNTVTDMLDKDHTKEEIRRLVNGGQRFHPYF